MLVYNFVEVEIQYDCTSQSSRISSDRVQWVMESNFSAVRKSRTFPLGVMDRDSHFASRFHEIMRHYVKALEILNAWDLDTLFFLSYASQFLGNVMLQFGLSLAICRYVHFFLFIRAIFFQLSLGILILELFRLNVS